MNRASVATVTAVAGLVLGAALVAQTPAPATLHDAFDAKQAYAYTAQVTGFGERWPGSPGHTKTQALVRDVLKKTGATIDSDDFTARTPRGPIEVHTLIGKFGVTADPAQPILILAGHYDTLFKPGFLGANDGASSTAILLAFAEALAKHKTRMQIWLVWTDLEEAINDFDANDGLYGSRHLAAKLAAAGIAPRVKGFFLLDMIGDRNLNVARETQSTRALQDVMARAAAQLNFGAYFFQYEMGITDDHVPFLEAGMPAVDVVDAEFGRMGPQFDGMGEFHHANTDTMDKVAQRSLDIVGRTMLLTVELLDAQNGAGKTEPVFTDGQAQIVPGFQDDTQWIRQTMWVEAEFDSDGDGKRDRLFTDVTRPRQTETEGLKVPVIYESSPYFAGTSGPREFLWDVKQEVGAPPPPRTSQPAIEFKATRASVSNSLVATWVPRGFAVVHSEAPGTGLSEGCPTVGDLPEQLAPKAIIDWLNGRAKAFTTIDGTEQVLATGWSTGKVGMTGTSYNGTIPLAAAVTGVQGLEAIIPIAPNTSYYHYYRSNGLVRHPGGWLGEDIDFLYDYVNSGNPAHREYCNRRYRDGEFAERRDRQTGDYNEFWASRDLLPKVGNIKAAVLMAHAFNDWNVVPEHSVRIVQALKGRVPLQVYYHQGGHGGAPPLELMNKWFTRYLYGIQNGVEKDPKAWIVREGPGTPGTPGTTGTAGTAGTPAGRGRGAMPAPTPYDDYPNPAAAPVVVRPQAGGAGIGGLAVSVAPRQGKETLTDNVEIAGNALAMAANSPHRLLYATPVLTEPVHLSGFSRITLSLASSKPAANLSVWLVRLPWNDGPISPNNLITRGWADPQNHAALAQGGDFHSRQRGEPLVPGTFYPMTFDLQPDDQIIPAGARIGLMIFSSDRDFTLWPAPGTQLTIDLDATMLSLPVVGGPSAFARAIGRQ